MRISFRLTSFLLAAISLAGCGGGGGTDNRPVTLQLAAKVGSADVVCGGTYRGLGSRNANLTVNDLRFFVSNVRLIDRSGEEHAVTLDQDGVWQYQNVALMDFENATAGCAEQGTVETNTTIRGSVDEGDYSGVRFDVGVPFELNHLDPTASPAPLNVFAMGWVWQVGHIFFRADLNANNAPWFVHIGSTGCESDSMTSAPTSPCSNPNIPTVTLTGYTLGSSVITLDLATLLQGVNLSGVTPDTAPGCMSERNDNECAEVYPNFGISLETGKCTNSCVDQSGFYLQ